MKHLRTTAALSALILLLLPLGAMAVDDGGGRSVFARGAGERALALGGAFGAVADGPTALFWNPAGLGRLDRTSFDAAHTNLIGMGFYEQFGAAALANWRLGTFGVALRRFGVDGIDQRDDRGTLLGEDLEDAETEFSFGYGRSLGEAWQVGASLKMQSQKLAGQSGSALGLDLGVQVRPLLVGGSDTPLARALSLGVTFRNVVEPTIRLMDEDVRDPASFRLATAADFPVHDEVEVLIALDMDKTSDMDTKFHAGAEVRLMDVLALRGGTHAGLLAAGAGVTWRNLTVNYAFEDNPLETVHRFGVGVAIGPTVDESRQQALDHQEAEVRRRLDEAFQAENQRRLADLLADARTALARDNYSLALQQVTTIRVLDPENPDIDDIEAAAYLGQARQAENIGDRAVAVIAYRRCLSVDPDHEEALMGLAKLNTENEALARRSREIRTLFDDGLLHYAAGDLLGARRSFQQVLELAPEDAEARSLLTSTENTLRLRADAQAEQAGAMAASGRYEEARRVLAQVAELVPDHPAIAHIEDEIAMAEAARRRAAEHEAARAADQARAQTTVPAPRSAEPVVPLKPSFHTLSTDRQAEVADLYRRGVTAAEDGRRDEAVAYWELVWNVAPDYQQVAEYLKQEYLAQGMEAFAAGQLDRAIEIWEQSLEIDPADARTQGYLERAYEHKARIREIRSSTS